MEASERLGAWIDGARDRAYFQGMKKALLLLFIVAIQTLAFADDETIPSDFVSHYQQMDGFKHLILWNTHDKTDLNMGFNAASGDHPNLIKISSFLGSGMALEYSVSQKGEETDVQNVYGRAFHGAHWNQLSETDLTKLRLVLKDLPSENVYPPIEHLVVVSFREDKNWITRSYDRDKLPQAVSQIYDIIGEREETKKVK